MINASRKAPQIQVKHHLYHWDVQNRPDYHVHQSWAFRSEAGHYYALHLPSPFQGFQHRRKYDVCHRVHSWRGSLRLAIWNLEVPGVLFLCLTIQQRRHERHAQAGSVCLIFNYFVFRIYVAPDMKEREKVCVYVCVCVCVLYC